MARPSLSTRSILSKPVQGPAAVGLKAIHDFFGLKLGFHDHVHMIGPHMRGQQTPIAVQAHLLQCREYGRTGITVQPIRRLSHALTFGCGTLWIGI
jgi:hypothetical protein